MCYWLVVYATFNGVIRFICSGCEKSDEEIKRHLAIMEKRFELWNENEGFYACTDKKVMTRLIGEHKQEGV